MIIRHLPSYFHNFLVNKKSTGGNNVKNLKRRKSGKLFISFGAIPLLLVLLLGGCGGGGSPVVVGRLSLEWDAPTTNEDGTPLTDLAGYKLYYGTASGVYDHSVDVGNVSAYDLSNLTKGQVYYLVVTAYNGSNTESVYSNEINGAAE